MARDIRHRNCGGALEKDLNIKYNVSPSTCLAVRVAKRSGEGHWYTEGHFTVPDNSNGINRPARIIVVAGIPGGVDLHPPRILHLPVRIDIVDI